MSKYNYLVEYINPMTGKMYNMEKFKTLSDISFKIGLPEQICKQIIRKVSNYCPYYKITIL